ncbi:MAG: hypothetical protein V7K89_24930 [Nostoc sp.]|uniref:hypothetical protein n=1 Tax=Nostoc sp. TaxID=1180 RepID=UPI002FF4626C
MGEAKRRKQQDPTWGLSFEAWGKLFQPNVKTYRTQFGLEVCNFQDLYQDMMWYHHRINLAVERRAEGNGTKKSSKPCRISGTDFKAIEQ